MAEFIRPSVELLAHTPDPEKLIELAGRVCWKSEDKISDDSSSKFIKMLMGKNHMSVLEHASATFRIITDRAIANEIVRHRTGKFSQESTRYVASASRPKIVLGTEESIVDAYNSGMTMAKVASAAGITEWEVYKTLQKNDVKSRSRNSRGTINHDFFDVIDTPEKAYLLGLIQADGSVRQEGCSPTLSITQHKDISWYIGHMLETFVAQFVSKNKDKDCHQMKVTSLHMWESLVSKGIIPNKSRMSGEREANLLWSSVPAHLKWDFLRGFMDGDGCIRFFKQKNKGETDSAALVFLGSKPLLEVIRVFLHESGFGTKSAVNKVHGAELYRLCISTPSVVEGICRNMMANFVFPYGNPNKTSRIVERIGGVYPFAASGDSKFKVMLPSFMSGDDARMSPSWWIWYQSMCESEKCYSKMLEAGCKPEVARSVLPLSLKTELVMTMDFRNWLHFIQMRTDKSAHPDVQIVAKMIQEKLREIAPVVFGGLDGQSD